jgi:hypothetical protein
VWKKLLLCIGISLICSPSFAGTFYVSKTGADTNTCQQAQALTAPKLTIQAGVNCAHAGDRVIVKGGFYSESVSVWPASGTALAPIVVTAASGESVIWNSGSNPAIINSNRSYIHISGFTFRDITALWTLRIYNATGNKTTNPMVGVEVRGNTFINNGRNGLLDGNSSSVILFGALGKDSTYGGSPINKISGNTFYGNYGNDIALSASSDTLVDSNLSTGTRGSKDKWNGNNFVARFVLVGGTSYNGIWSSPIRNVIEKNNVGSIQRDTYVNAPMEGGGIRLDSDADGNVIRYNVVHDILMGIPWSWSIRGFGIFPESRCDNNQIYQNVVHNVAEACYQLGTEQTTVAIGNQLINNVGYNCGIAGLILSNSKSDVVKNNIFWGNGHSQVYVTSTSVTAGAHTFANNDYGKAGVATMGMWNWVTSSAMYPPANMNLNQWNQASKETGSLSLDPQFVKVPTDFHLLLTSPLKGKGVGGVDMGAYPLVVNLVTAEGFRIEVSK